MKWNLKPLSLTKQFAASLALVTMCTTPLAQGAQAKAANTERIKMTQKEMIAQHLRTMGLISKTPITAGEYWKNARPVYPAKFQKYMDAWIIQNRNMPMPSIDASTVNGPDGEQVRLFFTNKENQSLTATFTGDPDRFVKINSVMLSKKELMDVNNFQGLLTKLTKNDAALKKMIEVNPPKRTWTKDSTLSVAEYSKLTPKQKAEYLIRLRRAVETAQNIYKATYGKQALDDIQKKHEYAVRLLFGMDAEAKAKAAKKSDLSGSVCIVAGWKSQYGENGSCGGNDSGWKDVTNQMKASKATCSGGGLACNPLVYGFDPGGNAFCMSRSDAKLATKNCNGLSPLDRDKDGNMFSKEQFAQNKEKIIESYMKKIKGQPVDLALDANGNVTLEQKAQIQGYLDDLNTYIGDAEAQCGISPLAETQTIRPDQKSACDEIRIRRIALEGFPVAPQPDLGGRNCNDELEGSMPAEDGKCACPEGGHEEEKEGRRVCAFADVLEGPVEKKEKKKGGNLLPILGILAVVGVGAYLIFKDKGGKKNPPTYVPPAPVSPVPTTSPTVIVEPPAPSCPEPKVIVNGVCTDMPSVPLGEGGTTPTTPDTGGAVR